MQSQKRKALTCKKAFPRRRRVCATVPSFITLPTLPAIYMLEAGDFVPADARLLVFNVSNARNLL